jgi:hypothetical protein
MASPSEPRLPAGRREIDAAALRREGIVAGIFGALLLAAWFLYLDTVRGRPLFTPTLLASAVLGRPGASAPDALEGSIGLTLAFTVVHTLFFAGLGLAAAEVLARFARARSRALLVLALWGVLCVVFFAFALQFSAVGPNAVAMRDALLGNAFAAFGMTAYLARNLPRGAGAPTGDAPPSNTAPGASSA